MKSPSFSNMQSSFHDKLVRFERLYDNAEDLDVEYLTQERLVIIQEAKKEMKKDNALAYYWYGNCLILGSEGFPVNIVHGIELLTQAAYMGHYSAYDVLGDLYLGLYPDIDEEMINEDLAILNYTKSSDSNSGYAAFRLAEIYAGSYDTKISLPRAIQYVNQAVSRGDAHGEYLKAFWMHDSSVIELDRDEMRKLVDSALEKELELGDLYRGHLYYLVGLLLIEGDIFEKDEASALEFMDLAINCGSQDAIIWREENSSENK